MATGEGPQAGQEPVHDVERGLAVAAEGVALALGARTWSLSQREVRDDLRRLGRLQRQLEALMLHLVRASASGDGGETPGRETVQWLQAHLKLTAGKARGLVEGAALVDPEVGALPGLGKALESGDVALEHVDHVRRAMSKLPAATVRDRGDEIDSTLAARLPLLNGYQAGVLCQHLVGALAPASQDHLDPFVRERRHLEYSLSHGGVLRGTFLLEGIDAATAKAVLDHLSAPGRDTDQAESTDQLPGTQDTRTLTQRRADALAAAFRLASVADGIGSRGGEPPHLLIHTTIDQLAAHPAFARPDKSAPGLASCEHTGPMSASLLQRAACDAVLQVVVLDRPGAVAELRTPQRLANRAQRRALAARDRGCAWPGCSVPASACDAHHVLWWSRGGRTELDNLVLLCPRHHTDIHCEEWRVTMREGLPWFVPPPWVDPAQTPVRNNLHDHVAAVERLAQQLRLEVDGDLAEGHPPDR